MTAAGRAPRLRRAGGGGVTADRVRFPLRRRAALVGGGIAAAPKVPYTQAEHDMASMRPLRAPCVPSLCAHFGSLLCVPALRTPGCPYCVHGALVQFVVDMCVLEPMPCACSSPCLLRVPMRCVLELCTLVLGVWCTCAALAQIVRHPLVNVVDIAGVHRPVLCAGAVHACVVVLVFPMLALRVPAVHALAVHACGMRACASHARVACTCCSCPALLCVPLLCIRVLRAFVLGVWCTCAAFSQIVRHPLVNVVDIAGVRRPVL